MLILGINAYHGDSSACIVKDGVMIAAVEEERFRRIKHWAGFPSMAVDYCLKEAGAQLSDVNHIAINQDPKANFGRKILYTLKNRPSVGFILERLRNRNKRESIPSQLNQHYPDQRFRGTLHQVEHHLTHVSSAYHVSPFDEAVVVSVDGFGDFASSAWGAGAGAQVAIDGRVYFPHSLGIFYQALTQYLGFPHYGDEYKVMGLAPYGQPSFMDQMREIVILHDDGTFSLNLDCFRHQKEKVDYRWENGAPVVGALYSEGLEELLGPARKKGEQLAPRHQHIAHSVQKMYEEAFFHLLRTLHARYKIDALCLAGGCAMNSVANGKVRRETPFRKLYVQSAAGDAGGAVGAAFAVWHQIGGEAAQKKAASHPHAYWGPQFTDEKIARILDQQKEAFQKEGCRIEMIENEEELCQATVDEITKGHVIGWFQGRMEWGPRALGNRSILCDPRRTDMKDILNLKIKRRESFRPFAPSILRESVSEWFEEEDNVPFMMQVYQIREEKRKKIPAVTHVDGSGRLQTVHSETNPLYHRLIRTFEQKTGVPMLLNTSFNENEPVVCRPEEAIDCFLRTNMDVLVLGSFLVRRGVGAES